jgi:hypothetical protein
MLRHTIQNAQGRTLCQKCIFFKLKSPMDMDSWSILLTCTVLPIIVLCDFISIKWKLVWEHFFNHCELQKSPTSWMMASLFPGWHGETRVGEPEVQTGTTQVHFRLKHQHRQGTHAGDLKKKHEFLHKFS